MLRVSIIILMLAIAASGCSPQQLFYTGQAWQKSLCGKSRGDDRARCEAEASKSYADFKREAADAQTSE